RQLRLLHDRQAGASPDEALVDTARQPPLIVGELRIVERIKDGLDTGKECRIEIDRIRGGAELRLPLALDRLDLAGRDVLAGDGEEPLDAVARASAALQRLDRVPEGRRCRIAHDGLGLGALLVDGPLKGLWKMLVAQTIERGYP